MYAIIEFLTGNKKEYAVVPVIWLHNNNKACYWPRVKTENEFFKLVKENVPYDKKWSQNKVYKVLKSSADHDSLEQELTEMLQQSTTDNTGSIPQRKITNDKTLHEDMESEGDDTPKKTQDESIDKKLKRKYKSKKYSVKKSRSSKTQSLAKAKLSSSSTSSVSSETDDKENDYTNEAGTHNSILQQNVSTPKNDDLLPNVFYPFKHSTPPLIRNITNVEHEMNLTSSESIGIERSLTGLKPIRSDLHTNQTITPSSISQTPRSRLYTSKNIPQQEFQIEVLTTLRTLDSEVSQINISLNQLTRSLQSGNIEKIIKPDGFPVLPIQTLEDFRSFDSLLKTEVFETYFTNRLAAIGGVTVRQGVMNCLKFTLTNKVAMVFNWAGREKEPFRNTETTKIITAAMKLRFSDNPDGTDICIANAIKDWLKQAKHRNACQEKI